MSKAKEYADKIREVEEMRRSIAVPTPPKDFAIFWPGGGKVVARVAPGGALDLTGGEISPEEAIGLRDWITETYGEGEAPDPAVEGPKWLPVSSHSGEFTDGERFLVAVEVVDSKSLRPSWWEVFILRVMCCSETPVSFVTDLDNEPFIDFDWEDLEYYIPLGREET